MYPKHPAVKREAEEDWGRKPLAMSSGSHSVKMKRLNLPMCSTASGPFVVAD